MPMIYWALGPPTVQHTIDILDSNMPELDYSQGCLAVAYHWNKHACSAKYG